MAAGNGTLVGNPTLVEDPDPGAVTDLLRAAALPVDDLDGSRPVRFFGYRHGARLTGVVGLELFGDVALLRSLAVDPVARGRGTGARLLAHAEASAAAARVRTLYLLTTTAADFFRARGYCDADRGGAPAAILATAEFASLCPAAAACLRKRLDA